MKTSMILIAACAALAAASQASALPNANGQNGWSFGPASTPFTSAAGTISFQINNQPTVNCNVTVSGQTRTAGPLQINSLTFADNGDGTCSDVSTYLADKQAWNPTAAHYAHWFRANFILSPKGIRCIGNLGMAVVSKAGADTMIQINQAVSSEAGACHVTAQIDVGNVAITKTPGQ